MFLFIYLFFFPLGELGYILDVSWWGASVRIPSRNPCSGLEWVAIWVSVLLPLCTMSTLRHMRPSCRVIFHNTQGPNSPTKRRKAFQYSTIILVRLIFFYKKSTFPSLTDCPFSTNTQCSSWPILIRLKGGLYASQNKSLTLKQKNQRTRWKVPFSKVYGGGTALPCCNLLCP